MKPGEPCVALWHRHHIIRQGKAEPALGTLLGGLACAPGFVRGALPWAVFAAQCKWMKPSPVHYVCSKADVPDVHYNPPCIGVSGKPISEAVEQYRDALRLDPRFGPMRTTIWAPFLVRRACRGRPGTTSISRHAQARFWPKPKINGAVALQKLRQLDAACNHYRQLSPDLSRMELMPT